MVSKWDISPTSKWKMLGLQPIDPNFLAGTSIRILHHLEEFNELVLSEIRHLLDMCNPHACLQKWNIAPPKKNPSGENPVSYIWVFPKIMVPPNHPFKEGFPL